MLMRQNIVTIFSFCFLLPVFYCNSSENGNAASDREAFASLLQGHVGRRAVCTYCTMALNCGRKPEKVMMGGHANCGALGTEPPTFLSLGLNLVHCWYSRLSSSLSPPAGYHGGEDLRPAGHQTVSIVPGGGPAADRAPLHHHRAGRALHVRAGAPGRHLREKEEDSHAFAPQGKKHQRKRRKNLNTKLFL